MIVYTLTPNPALDLSGRVESLVPNEKNYVSDEKRDPGGNGINAARVIHRLGARTLALGWLGGSTGGEILSLLKREGVPTRFTPIRGHTRVNVTVTDLSHHRQTRLTFHGPRVRPGEIVALKRQVSRLKGPGLFILGGSLPEGVPPDFHLAIAEVAAAAGLAVVIDVPARHMREITSRGRLRPLFMKPNQTELEEWAGRKLRTDAELARAAMRLARSVDLVCVSLAERGALLATERSAWIGRAPSVRARGTVGAGDSMVGAFCAELARAGLVSQAALAAAFERAPGGRLPRELERALRWGMAAGAATAEATGTALARPAEIRRLFARARVEGRAFATVLAFASGHGRVRLTMAKRLSAKHRKTRRDKATAYKTGKTPKRHKVAAQRSKRALKKKAYPMA